jgi:hypothetical protein
MTMQQVKINATNSEVGAAREGTHYSNHPLLVEGWHLGEDSTSATVPCGATSCARAGNLAASDAGDPEASASNDVVMQDAEVAPDRMAKLSRRRYEALEEDLNSLAALVARRPRAGGWRHSAECH